MAALRVRLLPGAEAQTSSQPKIPSRLRQLGDKAPRSLHIGQLLPPALVGVAGIRKLRRRVARRALTPLAERVISQRLARPLAAPSDSGPLASLSAKAPELPAELLAKLNHLPADISAKLPADFVAKLTKLLHLPSQVSASPALLPVALAAGAVSFFSLRRGKQEWLEELPLRYDGPWIAAYWQRRPWRLTTRFVEVAIRFGGFSLNVELDKLLGREEEVAEQRAREAKELITDLGPAFVKIMQVFASRPDALPEAYQKEFEGLLERVRPFGREEAMETLCRNLGGEEVVRSLFDDMAAFDKPVASASVGQVYRAKIQGREVAVKVQRPDVREQVTLDLFVVRKLASMGSYVPIERYARQFKSIFELVDRAAPPFIEELDYEFEADNQREFAELISKCELVADTVVVPEVVKSSREVLVQEWLPGKKLTEEGAAKNQSQQVVKVLLNSYMVQLLETGFLHGDPHPGNFVLTPEGKIGILDYGLMTRISPEKRVALIEYLIHVQANMYDECLEDLVTLEFLPEGIATDKEAREVIVPRLAETLNILFEQSDLRVQREKFIKQREELEAAGKLDVLQQELQKIAVKYGSFQLPGYATLIIRALATLEGVGLRANNNFSLSSETFPYIARRLLTDDGDRIRKALKAYLYKGRARMAPDRLENISRGFSTFTNLMKGDRNEAVAAGAPKPEDFAEPEGQSVDLDAATKDIAAVVFSPDGNFLQDLLIDEGVAAVDALSRASVSQVLRVLGPLGAPVAAPIQLILGSAGAEDRLLTREDKQALLVIRKIVQIIQAAQPTSSEPANFNLQQTLEGLQRLLPAASSLLPTLAPGASAFAQRFAQRLVARALQRLASDVASTSNVRDDLAVTA
mmetsp:Transcript_10552/g.24511  ORF Transcript_10552/g.24511 Transcript_10552/m.24511 type:complete len:865 (+) Transcript_10552:38-2632(+)